MVCAYLERSEATSSLLDISVTSSTCVRKNQVRVSLTRGVWPGLPLRCIYISRTRLHHRVSLHHPTGTLTQRCPPRYYPLAPCPLHRRGSHRHHIGARPGLHIRRIYIQLTEGSSYSDLQLLVRHASHLEHLGTIT